MVIYRACTALPTLRNEKGTKCMLGSFIDIYVLYTYLFRCDLQPCLPGLQVPMNHISYPSQHTEGRLAKSSKEGNRHLHPNYNLADLCAYEQDHFLKCFLLQ